MDLQGLSSICAGLGIIEEDDNGERISYTKHEFCLDNLKDLQRFLRRDDPQKRDVFKQICKWNIVAKDLVPIIEHCQDDKDLVITAVKVLVFLTMPIDPTSNEISQQIEYLWELKASVSRSDTIAVIISLLEGPLENMESEAFSEDDWKLVQLLLTLFRNLLAIQDISLQQKASGLATRYLSLRDRFLELLFTENVMDLILALTQHVGGSCAYLREDNLLLLEIYHYIFLGQEPDLIVKASQKDPKADEDVEASVDSLQSLMEEEEVKRRILRQRNMERHSQFSGTFTRVFVDGSKSLCKGNPSMTSRDRLHKPQVIHRGPIKRIVGDHGGLASSKEKILERLYDFVNQFLSGGYNELMQSVREDIAKEHPSIEKNDVVVFFLVAQFVTAFQRQKFLLLKKPKEDADLSEVFGNKYADNTLFQGDICGPVAATMNEAMFLLVISKWRSAFEGLKETNDYKSLSAAGSLMKNMIRMLDLVLKVLPDDSKEPQTARILLYKIFYDQTEQGLTQFLVTLIKSFNTHKQPRSDLADLVEMMHVVVRLMENLQARGTLRVCKKARTRRKKKALDNTNSTGGEKLESNSVNPQDDVNGLSCKQPEDSSMASNNTVEDNLVNLQEDINNTSSMPPKDLLESSDSIPKEDSISSPTQTGELTILQTDTEDVVGDSTYGENENHIQKPDSLAFESDDSSDDDMQAARNEVDFKVSGFVFTFANNSIIQNLCWLLKFYKSNSVSTNHYIVCMFRRICDDLELSPMLYQLSLLTTFYDILAEQKSSNSKEYANIVSFISDLVRRMMRKMKSQPLLFVELLFWKTRRECHWINSDSMINELGELRKETRNWGTEDHEKSVPSEENRRTNRSIADSLGDDEADVITTEPSNIGNYLNSNTNGMGPSSSNSDMDEGNFISDDLDNEGSPVEHRSQDLKRKKKLVFDENLETDIKNLYEKYKEDKKCSQAIANALQEAGTTLTATQVLRKLKQLGLHVPRKGRLSKSSVQSEERGELDEETLSTLKRSEDPKRKKRLILDENLETDIKNLYEKYKEDKKCSHEIANALQEAGKTITATQVVRVLKQLGLHAPQKARLSKSKLPSNEKDESDKETLTTFKKRRKGSAEGTSGNTNEKGNGVSGGDDIEDEFLSSLLAKKGKRSSSQVSLEATSTLDEFEDESLSSLRRKKSKTHLSNSNELLTEENVPTDVTGDAIDRDGNIHSTDADIPLENGKLILNDLEIDNIGSMDNVDDNETQETRDKLADGLEDLEDDIETVTPSMPTVRRKLKMVIDLDDEDE
ncbi:hypothetical protein ACHQM5_011584 [Ranunculus cassubicifolius]